MGFAFPRSLQTALALALIVSVAALAGLPGSPPAAADSGWSSGSGAKPLEVSFTKWLTTYPNMAGFVGGDAGAGAYAGEILQRDPTIAGGRITQILALYHVKGEAHSFTANLWISQDNWKGSAVLVGVVTEGRLKGSVVYGEYKLITCEQAASKTCFQGVLRVHWAY